MAIIWMELLVLPALLLLLHGLIVQVLVLLQLVMTVIT